MPDAPSRRRLLAVAGTALTAATAGCAGVDRPTETTPRTATTRSGSPSTARPIDREVTGTGTYANTVAGPREYPDRPVDASRAAVVEFVRTFEETRTYNGLHEPDATEIDVSMRMAHDREAHGGHYVVATAGGYANYEESTADWGVTRVLYFASPDLVVRTNRHEYRDADCERAFASGRSRATTPPRTPRRPARRRQPRSARTTAITNPTRSPSTSTTSATGTRSTSGATSTITRSATRSASAPPRTGPASTA
jgi:hypothetical protein